MAESFLLFLIIIVQGLVLLAMLAYAYISGKISPNARYKPLSKVKSQIEQHLVLETIFASSDDKDFRSTVFSIGKHAAEVTGYEDWIIWLRTTGNSFNVVATSFAGDKNKSVDISNINCPDLYNWVLRNDSSVKLGEFLVDLAADDSSGKVLKTMTNGLMIPFVDGQSILGFLILGGSESSRERRSEQFLNLYGAIAALIIKKSKLFEQKLALHQRQHQERSLANLGRLAAGLAHEIRNPLTFIRASIHQVQKETKETYDLKDITEGMVEEIKRVNQRVEELLILGRVKPQTFRQHDIKQLLHKVVVSARSIASERNVDIQLQISDEDATIIGSEDMLLELFSNLIINGIEAHIGSGRLTIRSKVQDDKVEIDLVDTGQGMDPSLAEKIFDPFFTTKKTGTGLGLSIAFSVAQAHDGTVELLKSDATGTCFRVTLPIEKQLQP